MGFSNWKSTEGKPLIHRAYEQGVGIIAVHEKRYLFTVGHERFWDLKSSSQVVTYSACGGKRDFGETFPQSAIREAREELSVAAELIPSPDTLFYEFTTGKTERVDLKDPCAPWLIYDLPVKRGVGYSVCVYPATIGSDPFPSREVPALLLLTPDQVIDEASHTLDDLLNSGAEIIEQRPVPRCAIIKPFGTAQILKKLQKNQLPLISTLV